MVLEELWKRIKCEILSWYDEYNGEGMGQDQEIWEISSHASFTKGTATYWTHTEDQALDFK